LCIEGTYSLVSRATLMADTEHTGLTEQQVLVKSIKGMQQTFSASNEGYNISDFSYIGSLAGEFRG